MALYESEFEYTKAVIDETLRLKNPAHGVSRQCAEDVTITISSEDSKSENITYNLPKDTGIVLLLSSANKDPKIWKTKVNEFVPERFLKNADESLKPNLSGSNRYAFVPFSVGARQCLGKNFALMEMVVAIAKICYHFEIENGNETNDIVEEKIEFTMKPASNIRLKIKPICRK